MTEEALRGVAVRRRDVRRDIGALLSPQTVLVGHALHHDLAALRLDHHPIIDTSLLFSYAALPDVTPSLKDLAQVVLKVSMRTKSEGRHDMVEDAVVAMQLVAHEMAQPRPTPPLPTLELKVPKEQLRKLLVHSIPSGTTPRDVAAVFELLGVPAEAIEGDVSSRKLHAVFKHPGDANEAFKRIPGRWETDNGGRRVKTAPLPGADSGRSVRVRQMACHGGMAFREPAAAAPPAPTAEDSARSSKKGKRPAASSVEAAAATANGHTSDGGSGSARKKRKHDKPPPAK